MGIGTGQIRNLLNGDIEQRRPLVNRSTRSRDISFSKASWGRVGSGRVGLGRAAHTEISALNYRRTRSALRAPLVISKNCRNRQTCCTCQGKNPTVLHVQRETPDLKPGAATSCHLSTHQLCHMGAKLPIVSVLVKLGDKELRTSAFLDSGSTHSFCSIQLFKELGVVSKKPSFIKSHHRGSRAATGRSSC